MRGTGNPVTLVETGVQADGCHCRKMGEWTTN